MRILDITLNDLYLIFKDWKPAVFLVAAPIIFTLMFGFMFGGFGGSDQDARLVVGWVQQDESNTTALLKTELENSDVIRLTELAETDLEALKKQVKDDKLTAVVIIPSGYGAALLNEENPLLSIIMDESGSAAKTAENEILMTANRLISAIKTANISADVYANAAGFADTTEKATYIDDALTRTLQAWQTPPVTALSTHTQADDSNDAAENSFAHSSPGMILQFAIAGIMGAAEVIVQERKTGNLKRLMTTSVSRFSILVGHWLAMFLMIALQMVVLIGFGQLALGLNYLAQPLATLAMALAVCALIASLGLLIGVLSREPEHTIVFSLIPMMVFAGLGGAWVPVEMMGGAVINIAKFTPIYWGMVGFKDILLRNAPLAGVLLPAGILMLMGLIFVIPAVILFLRRSEA